MTRGFQGIIINLQLVGAEACLLGLSAHICEVQLVPSFVLDLQVALLTLSSYAPAHVV